MSSWSLFQIALLQQLVKNRERTVFVFQSNVCPFHEVPNNKATGTVWTRPHRRCAYARVISDAAAPMQPRDTYLHSQSFRAHVKEYSDISIDTLSCMTRHMIHDILISYPGLERCWLDCRHWIWSSIHTGGPLHDVRYMQTNIDACIICAALVAAFPFVVAPRKSTGQILKSEKYANFILPYASTWHAALN